MANDPDTVDVILFDCKQCRWSNTPTYHGECDAPVVIVGSERLCSSCGVSIARPEAISSHIPHPKRAGEEFSLLYRLAEPDRGH